MNGPNIQNHSLMLSEYLHNIQYIDITIPSNSIVVFSLSYFLGVGRIHNKFRRSHEVHLLDFTAIVFTITEVQNIRLGNVTK